MAMFEKALIPVENTAPFEALRGAVTRALTPTEVEHFLKGLQSKGLKVRDWDGALQAGLFGADAIKNYSALNPAEQGMVREHYLESIEGVDPNLRMKFKNLFGYY